MTVFIIDYKFPEFVTNAPSEVRMDLIPGNNVSLGTKISSGSVEVVYSATDNANISLLLNDVVQLSVSGNPEIKKITFTGDPARSRSFLLTYDHKMYLCKMNYFNSAKSQCTVDFAAYTNNSEKYLFGLDIVLRLIDAYYIYFLVVIACVIAKKMA